MNSCRLNKLIYQHFPYDGKTQVTINGSDVTTKRILKHLLTKSIDDLNELVHQYFKETDFNVTTIVIPSMIGVFYLQRIWIDDGRKLKVDNGVSRVPLGGEVTFSGKDSTNRR